MRSPRSDPARRSTRLCCDERTGGIVDDLIAYLRSDEDLLLIPNAANCAEVVRRLTDAAPTAVQVRNAHKDYAVLAVQGQFSDETLGAIGLPTGHDYMAFDDGILAGRAGDGVPHRVHRGARLRVGGAVGRGRSCVGCVAGRR